MQLRPPCSTSLRQRLSVGLGTMLVPFLLLAGGALISFESAIDSFKKQENIGLEELFPLARTEGLLLDISGVVASGTETSEVDAVAAFKKLSDHINHNLTFILDRPSQLSERDESIDRIREEWKELEDLGLTILQPKVQADSKNRTSQILDFQEKIQNILQNVQELNYRLIAFQNAENLRQAEIVRGRVRVLVAIIFLMALTIAVICAYALSRSILVPLHQLQTGVTHLGEGNFKYRIRLRAQDEFAHLATTFNSMAKSLEQSQQDLERLATLDGLTEVYNRREFNRWLSVEVERSKRDSLPVSLIMVDIDHFKQLNDQYGHQVGDEALCLVAHLLRNEVRPGDIVSRYGGEEFAIILPKATINDSATVAHRIRREIAIQPIRISVDDRIHLTASLGLASFPDDGATEEDLLRRADQALYQAKKMGRNQVCLAAEILRSNPEL
ncbi:diguanylate cyclase [Acaryochloris sp. IP29b_bin.137]|uniref:diguanylate cyclase n=1 Tax=Acaryochloris sp. IP29b_bin.137 TaxID=2969217 RepID=UPI0026090AE7|nr:diguanylate cyclase [Acaryochloris sp. IP29b_bin.137]